MFSMARQPDPRAKAIEDLLFQMGESVRWLAEKIGKRHSTVNGWLNGAKPHDSKVWDEMMQVIRQHEEEAYSSANLRIRRTPRLTLPVISLTYKEGQPNDGQTRVYMNSVIIPTPLDGRKVWARPVEDSSLMPLAKVGDVLVFDERPAEIGHLVEAIVAGEPRNLILGGTKASPELVSPNPAYTDVIGGDFAVTGVAFMRIRQKEGGVRESLEYDFGIQSG